MKRIIIRLLLSLSWIQTYADLDSAKPKVSILPSPKEFTDKGSGPNYFQFENFPINQEFYSEFSRVLQKDPEVYGIADKQLLINKNRVLIKDGKTRYAFYCLNQTGFVLGERVSYRFKRKDGSIIAETSYIPRPFFIKSKQGTFSVEVELLAFSPGMYSLSLKNLNAGEKLHIHSKSYDEIMEIDIVCRKHTSLIHMPGVLGKNGGKCQLEITRTSGDKAHLELPWGETLISNSLEQFMRTPPPVDIQVGC